VLMGAVQRGASGVRGVAQRQNQIGKAQQRRQVAPRPGAAAWRGVVGAERSMTVSTPKTVLQRLGGANKWGFGSRAILAVRSGRQQVRIPRGPGLGAFVRALRHDPRSRAIVNH
jgi:hypothetical protein